MLARRASGPSPSRTRLAMGPAVLLCRRRARVLPARRIAGVPGPVMMARPFGSAAISATIVATALGVQAGLHVVDIVSASRVPRWCAVVTSRLVSASAVAMPAVVSRRKLARP